MKVIISEEIEISNAAAELLKTIEEKFKGKLHTGFDDQNKYTWGQYDYYTIWGITKKGLQVLNQL